MNEQVQQTIGKLEEEVKSLKIMLHENQHELKSLIENLCKK